MKAYLIEVLPERWSEHRDSNDWGSGEDRLSAAAMERIEESFYLDQCYENGLTEEEAQEVMEGLGY